MKKAQLEVATILVVSSDETICNVVRQALERADYCVLEVRDAEAALEIFRQSMERIDVLLTEVTIVSGRALVDSAARLRPRMKVIYMSRNVDLLLSQGVLTPDMAYLRKPFTGVEVLAKVQEVLRPSQRQTCPQCLSTNVRRSPRRWLDWLFIFTVPYRCQECRTRFYRFGIRLRSLV